jgi:putative tryptophan/tyrosine transport system substrate-binding protein
MRRRDFITAVAASTLVWPLATGAQQREKMRRVGVLMTLAADDPEGLARVTAFAQGLQELGWRDGRDVRIDYRWAGADAASFHRYAQELLTLAPDVIIAVATPSVVALQQATRTVPIVFVGVTDPVGAGLVESLAHPGGNSTGFSIFEYSISGKWLELLREIAPRLTRAAVIRDALLTSGTAQFSVIQSVAHSLGTELIPVGARSADEIERGLSNFARGPNGGVIVTASPLTAVHRNLIITLAAQYKLPVVYPFRYHVASGGLISYGPDQVDLFRRAASYVDRILKGERPADLPVEQPTKYELVINLRTARALGLEVPAQLLARADEVIE